MSLPSLILSETNVPLSGVPRYCSGLLAKEIVRRQLFPWESEYLPMFLKGYFKYCWHFSADIDEVEHFKRRIEARYLWKDIPPEYKDTYSFVYKAAYYPLYGACALPTNPEDYALMLDLCKAIVNLQE